MGTQQGIRKWAGEATLRVRAIDGRFATTLRRRFRRWAIEIRTILPKTGVGRLSETERVVDERRRADAGPINIRVSARR